MLNTNLVDGNWLLRNPKNEVNLACFETHQQADGSARNWSRGGTMELYKFELAGDVGRWMLFSTYRFGAVSSSARVKAVSA